MQITGKYAFSAPPQAMWDLLMDTKAIADCIPGCKELRPLGDDKYAAELVVGIAAITGNYNATVTLAEKTPPESYRLVVDASGRPGFVKASAVIALAAEGEGTAVSVTATADVGGTIARVGQRMIEGVARMSMDGFFACLAKKLPPAAEATPPPTAGETPSPATGDTPPAGTEDKGA